MLRGYGRIVCIGWFLLVLVWGVSAPAEETQPPLVLWPNPQQLTLGEGRFDVARATIFVPGNSGKKTDVVAHTLAARLKDTLNLRSLAIKESGTAPEGYFALAISREVPDWQAVVSGADFSEISPFLVSQAYLLQVNSAGATIVAREARGLSYGALTLIQLARHHARESTIPTVSITDWPAMELRAAHTRSTFPDHDRLKLAAAYAAEMKFNMLIWETNIRAFAFHTHPEAGTPHGEVITTQEEYLKMVNQVRDGGVELVPLHNFALGHWRKMGYPYTFLGDGETYYWAMKEIIDEEIELFRPRYYHLGMDEDHRSWKHLKYPSRSLEGWRDVCVEFTRHLRRKGIATMVWTDPLVKPWAGSNWYPWTFGKKFPEGYFTFTATFPSDLIFVPWFYWTKRPQDVLFGRGDVVRQAMTGLGVLPAGYESSCHHHTKAYTMIKEEFPNVLGVMGTNWGGNNSYPGYVRHNAGEFWNPKATKRSKEFTPLSDPQIEGWEIFLEDAPAKSVSESLKRLADAKWRVWLKAREELVAAGLPAVPVLLSAMSKAEGEYRERIEGCISRNARAARHGWIRGKLDVGATFAFLEAPQEDVRSIAAEVIASAADDGKRLLRKLLKHPRASVACARALGIVKDEDAVGDLMAVLADKGMPSVARAEAARVLGALRAKEAVPSLVKAFHQSQESNIEKQALWSLALMGHKEMVSDIVKLLDAPDEDTVYRAGIELVLLESPEVRKLEPWLEYHDRHKLELAAWALYKLLDAEEVSKMLKQAAATQTDEINKWRLLDLSKTVLGTGHYKRKY